jgi:hypothetical protein
MVTREQFLATLKKASVRPATVAGMDVFVRGVSADERALLISRARADNPLQAKELVALCVCDEAGDPVFTEADVAALGAADGDCLEKLAHDILTASSLVPNAEAEAAKN